MTVTCLLFLASCSGGCKGEPQDEIFALGREAQPASLEVAPDGVALALGESLRFAATLRNAPDNLRDRVIWLATGGSIDQTGLFIAGDQPGTYQVRAEVESPEGLLADFSEGLLVPPEVDDPVEIGTESSPDVAILIKEDFEDNNFRKWSSIAPSENPRWSGRGGGGAHIGDGYITDERAHSGRLAWKALIDPSRPSFDDGLPHKSALARWDSMQGVGEFYISAWYFIPTDFPPVPTLIMQAKASGPRFSPIGFALDTNRELIVRSGIVNRTLSRTGVKVPLGRWFNLIGRFVIADSGLMELWLDGELIASIRTDTRDGDFAYPSVANYISRSYYPVTCHMYIDDIQVTTEAPPSIQP